MTPFFGLNQNQVVLNISTNPPRANSDSQGDTAVRGEPRPDVGAFVLSLG